MCKQMASDAPMTDLLDDDVVMKPRVGQTNKEESDWAYCSTGNPDWGGWWFLQQTDKTNILVNDKVPVWRTRAFQSRVLKYAKRMP